jgi:N-methylhydantoinase A/oxoprolinase/acetone carboxylase beta subunit
LFEAAQGIIRIENTSMLEALQIVSIEKGRDPREHSLIAFGGAGPMYACQLAQELHMPKVIVPPSPGIFSAYGLLASDIVNDYSLSILQESDDVDLDNLTRLYEPLEQKGIEHVARCNVSKEKIRVSRLIDMRYVGQGYELTIPVEAGKISGKVWKAIVDRFHETHKKLYGHSVPGTKTEFTCIRVNVTGSMGKLIFARVTKGNENPRAALRETRKVYLESNEYEFSIYNRYKLLENNIIQGPSIVEENDSTTLIPSGWRATVDMFGVLHITRKQDERAC